MTRNKQWDETEPMSPSLQYFVLLQRNYGPHENKKNNFEN